MYGEDDISEQLKAEIIDHLYHLGNEFKRYFPGIDTACITMSLARNPFMCMLDDVPTNFKMSSWSSYTTPVQRISFVFRTSRTFGLICAETTHG